MKCSPQLSITCIKICQLHQPNLRRMWTMTVAWKREYISYTLPLPFVLMLILHFQFGAIGSNRTGWVSAADQNVVVHIETCVHIHHETDQIAIGTEGETTTARQQSRCDYEIVGEKYATDSRQFGNQRWTGPIESAGANRMEIEIAVVIGTTAKREISNCPASIAYDGRRREQCHTTGIDQFRNESCWIAGCIQSNRGDTKWIGFVAKWKMIHERFHRVNIPIWKWKMTMKQKKRKN